MRAVHLAIERETLAGVFVGIGEHAQAVELRGFDELAELFEIRLGFAGEADDHAGADGDAGNGAADALDQLEENIAARAALHALQHRGAGMLQRHVDVLHQRRVFAAMVSSSFCVTLFG